MENQKTLTLEFDWQLKEFSCLTRLAGTKTLPWRGTSPVSGNSCRRFPSYLLPGTASKALVCVTLLEQELIDIKEELSEQQKADDLLQSGIVKINNQVE
jgi:hypothetical protein